MHPTSYCAYPPLSEMSLDPAVQPTNFEICKMGSKRKIQVIALSFVSAKFICMRRYMLICRTPCSDLQ
jgi:hypothetical protein